MKKNISINISGIIFHIEEDGYDSLRKYLDAIHKYFSSFEDSTEIMADIESRIAEIFLSKLNEEKQVITAEDVNALIATMGSVSDFKAAEEQEVQEPANARQESNAGSTSSNTDTSSGSAKSTFTYAGARQLKRDQQRKILGGVCAGLAHYANLDAVWIRLLFTVLAFASYGVALVAYLVMWIVIPGSYTLEEPQVEKKMFRDPERKVLGGVSGGLASYFGVDIVLIRVLFVAFTFAAGFGLLIYAVLWIILPEAKSLTDRMQMQGEPVTLSNIDSTIKKNKSADQPEEENAVTKILLFPFRLIGMILTGVAKILVPLIEVLRVAIGVILILTGVGLAFITIVLGGVTLGLFSSAAFSFIGPDHFAMPIEPFMRAFPVWLAVAAFLACFIPCVFLILLGSSIIAKRNTAGAAAGWTLFVFFFISVILLAVGIPRIIYAFREEGTHKVETVYPITGKRALLRLNEVGMEDYDQISLSLRGYDGKDLKLVQEFQAQGSTRLNAMENAKMVDYHVAVQDSIFTFDSNITFKNDAIFRVQRLDMYLYIPYNYPFTMTEDVSRFINQYVNEESLDGQTWHITQKEGLKCLTCPPAPPQEEEPLSELEISGHFDVRVTHGSEYNIEMIGPENEKSKYDIERHGNTLTINYHQDQSDWKNFMRFEKIRMNITLPALEKVEASGAGDLSFKGFESDDIDIDITGAIEAHGEIKANKLSLDVTGASNVELEGQASTMDATITGASIFHGYRFEVQNAFVEANGTSTAEVNVIENLEIREDFVSKVKYRGNPNISKHE